MTKGRPTKRPQATCPTCAERITVNNDGRLRLHNFGEGEHCSGSWIKVVAR